MVLVPVTCPYCHSDQIIKGGQTETGKQRYRCHNPDCPYQSFLLRLILDSRSVKFEDELMASFANCLNLLKYQ